MHLLRILGCAALFVPIVGCDTQEAPPPDRSSPPVPDPQSTRPPQPAKTKVTGRYCQRVDDEVRVIDAVKAGIDLKQLTDRASGTFRGTWMLHPMKWPPLFPITIEPSAEGSRGTITVQYLGGVVRHVKEELVQCDPEVECDPWIPDCLDRLEIEMQLSMESDNGVLAEHRVAELLEIDYRDPDVHFGPGQEPGPLHFADTGWVRARILPAALMGTGQLQVSPFKPGFTLQSHTLGLSAQIQHNRLLDAWIFSDILAAAPTMVPGGLAGGSTTLYRFVPDPQ